MQEIKRRQTITEGLYLYLLQKREETAISSTSSNLSNYQQIDSAKISGPTDPDATNIKFYSILFGITLPIGLIYLRDLLNDKITTRDDITSKVPITILGDISHIPKRKLEGVSVLNRNVIGEQFRIIRTNLSFLINKKGPNTILINSAAMGEGKTFVSVNLATVLALSGKKVALLEFDLRRPGIIKKIALDNSKGITNFLSGQTTVLSELSQTLESTPTLHIYPCGPVPPNPGDLLLSDRLGDFFNLLKQQYDYIIIDSAPSILVSDAFILAEHCDAAVFVVRQKITLKKHLNFVYELLKTNKLNNVGIVFNDIKSGRKYGYYGYSYGSYEANTKHLKIKPRNSDK